MSTPTGPREAWTVRLDARGHGELQVDDRVVDLQEVDLAAARTEALRQVAARATPGAPARLIAIDPSGQRELLVYCDGRVAPVTPTTASARPATTAAGRGRSSLPAADALRVPDREDTDATPPGSPLGSPADVLASPSVSSRPLPEISDPINPGAEDSPRAVGSSTGRHRRGPVIGAVIVVALGLGGGGTAWVHERSARDAHAGAEARASLEAKVEASAAASASAMAAAAQTRIQGALDAAAQVLAASDGHVADNAVRDELAAAIAQTKSALATPDEGSWTSAEQRLAAAVPAVTAAQGDWERAEAERAAAEQAAQQAAAEAAQQAAAEAAARAATKAPANASRPQQAPAAPAPAPAAPAAPQSGEGRVTAIVANLSSGAGTASISVRVTTNGQTAVTVTATIGGQSLSLTGPGTVDGTATFTGTASGLPAGVQSWTASAGGIATSGSIEVF